MCREQETDILKEQIDKLNTAIMREEEKAHDLETKARYVSHAFVCRVLKLRSTFKRKGDGDSCNHHERT